jgi:hypothetical protein
MGSNPTTHIFCAKNAATYDFNDGAAGQGLPRNLMTSLNPKDFVGKTPESGSVFEYFKSSFGNEFI